jgi:hypothetical protein
VAIPEKPPARLNYDLKLIPGQRFFRFSILKETSLTPWMSAILNT